MADPNPSDLLQQLRDSLKSSKENSVTLVKEISVLESRVADLSRITGEIDQKVSAYDKAQAGLDKQRGEVDDFAKAKQELLEDSLPDKQAIQDAQKKGEDDLKKVLDDLQKSSDKVDKAQAELEVLGTTLDAKKTDYASKVDLGTGLTKDLKELQDLRKLADQENDDNNFARMYFYVLEMGDKLAAVTVPVTADYRKSLEAAAVSLAKAIEDVRAKKDEVDKAIADMKKTQADFDDAKAKRRETTVAGIPAGLGV